MKTRYRDVPAYITKDGSEIRTDQKTGVRKPGSDH